MEMKMDDLLTFCAYYTINKTALHLSHSSPPTPPPLQPIRSQQPQLKVTRKKFEVQPKKSQKVGKPRMEVMSNVSQKSKSPIVQQRKREENNPKSYDLNFFVSHLSAKNTQQSNWQSSQKRQNEGQYGQKVNSNLQNYETFGRSADRAAEYQTFEDKIRRQPRGNLTDRYEKPEYPISQFLLKPQQKPDNWQSNSWMYPSQIHQRTVPHQFLNIDNTKSRVHGGPLFENLQQTQSKLTYSPIKREFTPNGSAILNRTSPDSCLSKSRTKHQRKKSERPFYDASKLTVRKESEVVVRLKEDKKDLSQSIISISETQSYTNPRKAEGDGNKRQTSTTAPPFRSNREPKHLVRLQRNEIDLDDGLGQTLTELSHRRAPVAFELRMNGER